MPCLLQVLVVSFQGSVHIVDFLVDQAEFEINTGDFRMVLSNRGLQDFQRTVEVFESFREVATVVVVHRELCVTESDLWMLKAKNSFLEEHSFGLELDGLQIIAKLELDLCDVLDALCHFFVHGSLHLQEHVDSL